MLYKNLSSTELIEQAVLREEVLLSQEGALVAVTGKITGRAAKDKYIVKDDKTADKINWGSINQPLSPDNFQKLKKRVLESLADDDVFAVEVSVGADRRYAMPVTVQTPLAYQALFAKTMFRGAEGFAATSPFPAFTVYSAPLALANPQTDGTRSETFIAINFSTREVVIGGTKYCGEIKKSVFTIMNYLLPQQGVMTMHASANTNPNHKTAIFFGLSGTGKTTLSADATRQLVGDDEHGWSKDGVFNFEGGCYAKAIKLSAKSEPEIWNACHRFGTILENVVMDKLTRVVDFNADAITENTRAAYKLDAIPNVKPDSMAGHPTAVIMLACDCFGVLPPVVRLSNEQAMYYFLSGYTAKVAGTEAGVKEPTSTFSACFGEPFMALHPVVYATLLGEHLSKRKVPVYLINTGWWKGPYGVGERMPIAISRAVVNAAIDGALVEANYTRDSLFGFEIPNAVGGVPSEALTPVKMWSSEEAYYQQAKKLAGLFVENFKRYEGVKEAEFIRKAGPQF